MSSNCQVKLKVSFLAMITFQAKKNFYIFEKKWNFANIILYYKNNNFGKKRLSFHLW